ncbi:MAG: pyruvate dehydrogenase (acetyl-transferring) E1 component subunit alpha [Candidatus Aminicenantes bacterium RBG_13_59_9]|nr:MAG: pyruvate dehydrogenase (acetyl-transferring) E1 component subunit alpha [Candidatus Aminicenantes bacterium RBG_13_59_9]
MMEGLFQVLTEDGRARTEVEPPLSSADLRKLYSLMAATRAADLKALKLQRQGRMGTFAPSLGHEACQVGSAFALEPKDWVFPYFRDLGAFMTLGLPLKNYYLYWMGNEEGMRIPAGLNIFTISVPVASQIPHAVGCGMALKYAQEQAAALVYFGDGATSEGDFSEALNFAGVFKTPNIFICVNNQYAISTPVARQTAAPTLAQKASAYGFEGVRADGNDVLAMFALTRKALEKARSGGGPTLIEAFTYRMGNHTTSDDASRYRQEAELNEWSRRDPIERFRLYLKGKGLWDEDFESRVQKEAEDLIGKAVEEAESVPSPRPEDLFIHTYKNMTPELSDQLAELRDFLKREPR